MMALLRSVGSRPVGGSIQARPMADDRRGGAVLAGTGRDGRRPATYRDVLASREFRGIYGAGGLSWIGDATARAAVTALVFHATGSAAASAGAFALTYAPYLLGGSLLVSLAERYPHRTVMVTRDVARDHHGRHRHPARAGAAGPGAGPFRRVLRAAVRRRPI